MSDNKQAAKVAVAQLQHGLDTGVSLDELDVLVEEAKAEIHRLYPDMEGQ